MRRLRCTVVCAPYQRSLRPNPAHSTSRDGAWKSSHTPATVNARREELGGGRAVGGGGGGGGFVRSQQLGEAALHVGLRERIGGRAIEQRA